MKYRGSKSVADFFFELLLIKSSLLEITKKIEFIVPIPQSRKSHRPFSPTLYIGERLSLHLQVPFLPILQPPQKGSLARVNPRLREKLIDRKYTINERYNFSGGSVLLFDDVVTTGKTVTSASKELHRKGISHIALLTIASSKNIYE
jgi:predicted amidophosphoribosyltransferase